MSQFISEIFSIGGRSLEKDDEFHEWYSQQRGEVGGLLTVNRPCFYPYVFGRALLPIYDCDLQFDNTERCFGELKVKHERKNYFFIMETWKEGEPLTPLTESVARLARSSARAYLLVFSASPPSQTEAHLRLVDGLPGVASRTGAHRFHTRNEKGEEFEFWVGAWQVGSKR
jgi:hypothetical protein